MVNINPPLNISYRAMITGVICAYGDVMYLHTDSKIYLANASSSTTLPAVVMCLGTGAVSGSVLVTTGDVVTNSTWAWTVGDPIYVSITGTTGNTLTQTIPSASGNQVQIVGWALSATSMMFAPNLMILGIA